MIDAELMARDILYPALNIFGGADGGVDFANVKTNLIKCVEGAKKGDATCKLLLAEFEKMNRMLTSFTKPIRFQYSNLYIEYKGDYKMKTALCIAIVIGFGFYALQKSDKEFVKANEYKIHKMSYGECIQNIPCN